MNPGDQELPQRFADAAALEEFMSLPTPGLVDDLARVDGDIMVLGVGGKMGPTLARMAKRAAPDKRVIGVARFSDPVVMEALSATASNASPATCWTGMRCSACPTWPRG
jgi:hypothetical protein